MKKENNSFFQEYSTQFKEAQGLRRWKKRTQVKIKIWKFTVWFLECFKRIFDFSIALTVLIVLFPLLFLITVLIKMEDGGPIFFRQPRVGKYGRIFFIVKFRSMAPNAEQELEGVLAQNVHGKGVTFKIKDDPRMTRVGRWMRRFSFDEFPQLFNVLSGDMSLVGPRPPVIPEVAKYKAFHLRRLIIKPGITCFWQISGRSNIDFEGQVRLDLKYIHSQSFLTDLKILIQTIPAVIFGKGAY